MKECHIADPATRAACQMLPNTCVAEELITIQEDALSFAILFGKQVGLDKVVTQRRMLPLIEGCVRKAQLPRILNQTETEIRALKN